MTNTHSQYGLAFINRVVGYGTYKSIQFVNNGSLELCDFLLYAKARQELIFSEFIPQLDDALEQSNSSAIGYNDSSAFIGPDTTLLSYADNPTYDISLTTQDLKQILLEWYYFLHPEEEITDEPVLI